MNKGTLTTEATEVKKKKKKKKKKIISCYYVDNFLDNLHELDKFLETT